MKNRIAELIRISVDTRIHGEARLVDMFHRCKTIESTIQPYGEALSLMKNKFLYITSNRRVPNIAKDDFHEISLG